MLFRRAFIAAALLASSPNFIFAEEAYSGATGAYIDWAVRACEFKSTDKNRILVEQAKAGGETRFSEQYMKAYGSKELTEANGFKTSTSKFCEKVLDGYGPAGSRLPGLLTKAAVETPAAPCSQSMPQTKGGGSGGPGKRGP